MKKIILVSMAFMFGIAAWSQAPTYFTPIHNYQAPDGLSLVKYFGIPYGPDTTFNGVVRNVPGALFFRTSDSSLYTWSGSRWIKPTQGSISISGSGLDSGNVIGNMICFYKDGVSRCFSLDQFHQNAVLRPTDSLYIYFYNNGIKIDSVYLPRSIAVGSANLTVVKAAGDSIKFKVVVPDSSTTPTNSLTIGADGIIKKAAKSSGIDPNAIISVATISLPPDSAALTLTHNSGQVDTVTYSARKALYQNGNSFGTALVAGSVDNYNFNFIQNNLTRMYLSNSDGKLKINNGITLLGTAPNYASLDFLDGNTSIRINNSSFVVHNAYSGRWKFTNSNTGVDQFVMTEAAESYPNPMKIGAADLPDTSSVLELQSNGNKGLLFPRVTTAQKVAIGSYVTTFSLTTGGSGYTNGTYTDIPTTGGSGTNMRISVTVVGGTVTTVSLTNSGKGYAAGNTVSSASIGGGTGFVVTINTVGRKGLQVFDTDLNSTFQYNGTAWQDLYNAGSGGTVSSVGLTSSDITVGGTSPITTSGTYTLTLPTVNSNVGSFTNANITVNAKGQVTAASSGSAMGTETKERYASSTSTTKTLSHTPLFSTAVEVFLNGVLQDTGQYGISGTTITLTFTPETTDVVTAKYTY